MDSELCFAPATELRSKIDNKEISIIELTQLFLDRIQLLNPKLNAYLTVCEEQALAAAQEAQKAIEQGNHRGPLHGIPISIKDLEMTQGITTTMGSLIYKDSIPSIDSVVVERVKESGAFILGKTNTPEVDKYGDHPHVEFAWGIGGDDKMNSSSWILHGYFERQKKLLGI